MIRLEKPSFDQNVIIKESLSNMRPGERKTNILLSQENIVQKSREYDELACKEELYTLAEHDRVGGGAKKDDMIALYEQKFVPKDQICRKYYDKLILLAHNEKCPYCGQQVVKTLDHYLPKTLYPTYAITPYNLVPSCEACNT